jgi:hypothetical protein
MPHTIFQVFFSQWLFYALYTTHANNLNILLQKATAALITCTCLPWNKYEPLLLDDEDLNEVIDISNSLAGIENDMQTPDICLEKIVIGDITKPRSVIKNSFLLLLFYETN